MVRWPTSSSGACFCSLLVGCVVGCFRFSFFRALFCIDQLEPWNQIDVFGFKGRAMGLVFCLLQSTHKQEKEEFQTFKLVWFSVSNKYQPVSPFLFSRSMHFSTIGFVLFCLRSVFAP